MTVSANKTWCPAIELNETSTSLVLKAEVPGVEIKHLDVQVSQKTLSIVGAHPKEDNAAQREIIPSELHYGQLECTIPLPVLVQNDQVRAELVDGILTITMPKLENVS